MLHGDPDPARQRDGQGAARDVGAGRQWRSQARRADRELQDAGRRRTSLRAALAEESMQAGRPARGQGRTTSSASSARLEDKIEVLEHQLQAEFPRYARLTAERPLPAAEVQALLRADEALVAMLPGQRHLRRGRPAATACTRTGRGIGRSRARRPRSRRCARASTCPRARTARSTWRARATCTPRCSAPPTACWPVSATC